MGKFGLLGHIVLSIWSIDIINRFDDQIVMLWKISKIITLIKCANKHFG